MNSIKNHPRTSLASTLTFLAWLFTQPELGGLLPQSWGNKIMILGILISGWLAHDGSKPKPSSPISRMSSVWRPPVLLVCLFCLLMAGCAKPVANIPQAPAPATRQDVAKSGVVAAANVYTGLTFASDLIEQLNKGTPQVLGDKEALKGYRILRSVGNHTKDFKNAAIRFGTVNASDAPTLKAFIESALKELSELQSLHFSDPQKRREFLAFVETARQGYQTYQTLLQLFGKNTLTTDQLGIPQLQKLDAAPNSI